MTVVEAYQVAPANEEEMTWEQISSFARWATKHGLEVDDIEDAEVPGGHLLVVHEPEQSEAA
jgi:hypothetical protein